MLNVGNGGMMVNRSFPHFLRLAPVLKATLFHFSMLWTHQFGGFLSHRDTPSHHPFLDGVFPLFKPSTVFGVPPWRAGKPSIQRPRGLRLDELKGQGESEGTSGQSLLDFVHFGCKIYEPWCCEKWSRGEEPALVRFVLIEMYVYNTAYMYIYIYTYIALHCIIFQYFSFLCYL